VLVAGAHAEKFAGDQDVSRLDLVLEFRIDAAHDSVDVSGIDGVAEFPDVSFDQQ
jgi:hypothetical protein